MKMLNVLMSEHDLAKLDVAQRSHLVDRINHTLDTDEQIRKIVATKLRESLKHVDAKIKLAQSE